MTATDQPATPRKRAAKPKPEETSENGGTAGLISTEQMRRLHGLLRDHGITGDKAVHDYLATAGYPVESRSTLGKVEAAHVIAELEAAPKPVTGASIVECLSQVMNNVRSVAKGSQAPGNIGGFMFRGVDAVVNAVAPALREAGVVVMPEILHVERVATQSRGGANMLNVYVTTRYTFYGPAGDSLSTVVLGEAADAGDKATSKAQSVALRVALLQALMLPTDDVVDPDAEGYVRAGPQEPQQPQAPPPYMGPSTAELLGMIDDHAERAGKPYAEFTAKYRAENGGLSVDDLDRLPAPQVAEWEAKIAAYFRANPPADPMPGA